MTFFGRPSSSRRSPSPSRELSPKRQSHRLATLERELATVRAECERLAEAIGRGGPLDALLERLNPGKYLSSRTRHKRTNAHSGVDGPHGDRRERPDGGRQPPAARRS